MENVSSIHCRVVFINILLGDAYLFGAEALNFPQLSDPWASPDIISIIFILEACTYLDFLERSRSSGENSLKN